MKIEKIHTFKSPIKVPVNFFEVQLKVLGCLFSAHNSTAFHFNLYTFTTQFNTRFGPKWQFWLQKDKNLFILHNGLISKKRVNLIKWYHNHTKVLCYQFQILSTDELNRDCSIFSCLKKINFRLQYLYCNDTFIQYLRVSEFQR